MLELALGLARLAPAETGSCIAGPDSCLRLLPTG